MLYPNWLTFFFLTGARLPDPNRRLQGSGKIVRHVRLAGPETLDEPPIEALIQMALDEAGVEPKQKSPRRLIIKSISPKQRPRR